MPFAFLCLSVSRTAVQAGKETLWVDLLPVPHLAGMSPKGLFLCPSISVGDGETIGNMEQSTDGTGFSLGSP